MLENSPYALVIGGANIDFTAFPKTSLIWHDSNPGVIKTSLGGVGRNVAENLARLGMPTKLLSLVGDDAYGAQLIQETTRSGVDMSAVDTLSGERTSTYFSVMNTDDDMAVAIADMDIIDLLTPIRLESHIDLIAGAELVVVDTNLLAKTLNFLLIEFPKTRFLVDPVSVTKAEKIKALLPYIHTLKPNRLESEYLTDMRINNLNDAYRAIDCFIEQGVQRVFMSLGADGLVYGSGDERCHCPACPTQVVNATGAGDSMMASIAYGTMQQLAPATMLRFANATASLTLQAETTIAPDLSVATIESMMSSK